MKATKQIKKCESCGAEFETDRGYQKYCSRECRLEMSRSLAKQRTQEKKKKKDDSLGRACIEARRLGITYGQYQAMQYIKMLRGE